VRLSQSLYWKGNDLLGPNDESRLAGPSKGNPGAQSRYSVRERAALPCDGRRGSPPTALAADSVASRSSSERICPAGRGSQQFLSVAAKTLSAACSRLSRRDAHPRHSLCEVIKNVDCRPQVDRLKRLTRSRRRTVPAGMNLSGCLTRRAKRNARPGPDTVTRSHLCVHSYTSDQCLPLTTRLHVPAA
jgi:hypothetical protein